MADNQPESTPLGSQYYFVMRRLHSLAGLVPIGVFLCIHLTANATILVPGEHGAEFQRSVDRIHMLGPLLIPVEIVGIFIPIMFHALLGFQIILSGASNAQQYRYGGNIRYTAQRITGVIAFVFLLYHVWQMHWLGAPLGGAKFDPQDATRTAAMTIQAAWWIAPIYTIGVLATVFHLANGIWTLLITWGITIKPQSQRTAGYVCAAFGVAMSLLGLGALRGFKTFDVQGAASHGDAINAAHGDVIGTTHGDGISTATVRERPQRMGEHTRIGHPKPLGHARGTDVHGDGISTAHGNGT